MQEKNTKQVLSLILFVALVLLVVAFFATALDGVGDMLDDTTKDKPADTTVKLDCKHGETILGENGNTYCKACNTLTALKVPVLAVSENTVTWGKNAEAESYSVYINGNMVKRVTTNSYEFTASSSGEYTVTVKAEKGTMSSEESNSHTFKVLASPTIFLNGNIVTWSAVANADAYILYIDYEGLGWRVVDAIRNADQLTAGELRFDLEELLGDTIAANASVKIAVTAEDAGESTYMESAKSNQLTWVNVPNVYSVTKNITNGTLTGATSVKDGTTYTATLTASDYYCINKGSLVITMNGQTLTASIDNNLIYGEEYTVTYEDAYSAVIQIPGVIGNLTITATCIADTLPAPTNLVTTGGKLIWDAVPGASSYAVTVSIGGVTREFNTTLTSFDILENSYTESGEYIITVWARSPVGALSNGAFATLTYIKQPTIMDAENGTVSFKFKKDAVADSYNVYLNGSTCESALDAEEDGFYTITIPESELRSGVNYVYIVLYANSVSVTSNTLTFAYESVPSTGEETGPFTVNIAVTGGYACDFNSLQRIDSLSVEKGQDCSFYVLSSAGLNFDAFSATSSAGTLVEGTNYIVTINPVGAPETFEGQQAALVTINHVTANIAFNISCA